MCLNKAILMGFLGSDAEVRTGKNNQKFTTFSIATKLSYKSKETGEYVSHTPRERLTLLPLVNGCLKALRWTT